MTSVKDFNTYSYLEEEELEEETLKEQLDRLWKENDYDKSQMPRWALELDEELIQLAITASHISWHLSLVKN